MGAADEMTGRDQKFAVVASCLLTISVAVNMAAFQAKPPGSAIETGGLGPRTAWVDGPGLGLGPTVPGPANAAEPPLPGPGAPAAPDTAGDTNSAEITRGIQRELDARGYEAGQPDGVAGVVTRAAIFAYEYDNGLVLTGRPSEPLLSQIVLGSSSLAQNGSRPGKTMTADGEALVRGVKQQLSGLGYQTGAAGGGLTPEFARAIREFEVDQKLKASGRISGPMMSRLIRLQGEGKTRRNAVAGATSR
jgi:peptidoglycan hydrolase-like protein with peptidoglycan-binding domain